MSEITNRYDFLLFFDVCDGNPNGDPDAGNLPRVDAETGHGLVTDVCLKRKVRNYVQLTRENTPGYKIFIQEKAILNVSIDEAYETEKVMGAADRDKADRAREWMCEKYYDIRTFGAVMSTGKNAGQVRGPIQMTFARSVAPVIPLDFCITRMAVTSENDAKDNGDNRTMGRKFTIPYGLYVARGFVSPQLAQKTGFTQEDLDLFFQALIDMFEFDRSAARGMMATRRLIVFKHNSELGNAPAWKLFDLVTTAQNDPDKPARQFNDFTIAVDRASVPAGVEILDMV